MVGRRNYETLWSETNALRQIVHTPEQYLDELKDLIQRWYLLEDFLFKIIFIKFNFLGLLFTFLLWPPRL